MNHRLLFVKLNICTQAITAANMALITYIFNIDQIAPLLAAYIYKDVVIYCNVGELQALLFSSKYKKYGENTVLLISFSLIQLTVWWGILELLKIDTKIIFIILFEYLYFFGINFYKGFGLIVKAIIFQMILASSNTIAIILSSGNFEDYLIIRLIFTVILCLFLLVKCFTENTLVFYGKVHVNKLKEHMFDGMKLQAKEIYSLCVLTVPKFIAMNVYSKEYFVKYMLSMAIVQAISSVIQAFYQADIHKKLNNIQSNAVKYLSIKSELMLCFLMITIAGFIANAWINKGLSKLNFESFGFLLIMLYSVPFLSLPKFFIGIRVRPLDTYSLGILFIISLALVDSIYEKNIYTQILFIFTLFFVLHSYNKKLSS